MHQLTHFPFFSVLSQCFRIYTVGQISFNISGFVMPLKLQKTSVSMVACF